MLRFACHHLCWSLSFLGMSSGKYLPTSALKKISKQTNKHFIREAGHQFSYCGSPQSSDIFSTILLSPLYSYRVGVVGHSCRTSSFLFIVCALLLHQLRGLISSSGGEKSFLLLSLSQPLLIHTMLTPFEFRSSECGSWGWGWGCLYCSDAPLFICWVGRPLKLW